MKKLFWLFVYLIATTHAVVANGNFLVNSIIVSDNEEKRVSGKNTPVKKYFVKSNPVGAEILVNGQRQGVTPFVLSLGKGHHKIEVSKPGYLNRKQYWFIGGSASSLVDTLEYTLEANTSLYVTSDQEGLDLLIKREEDTVLYRKLPAKLGLPLGDYTMELFNAGKKCFKGSLNHDGYKAIEVPCYSKRTLALLVVDYFLGRFHLNNTKKSNLYRLFAAGQFGRFTLIPGLSTSIAKILIAQIVKRYKSAKATMAHQITEEIVQFKYPNYIPAISPLFLNAEFRAGVPITNILDASVLGTYSYYPSFVKHGPFHHMTGHDIFIGLEFSSRWSIFNMNLKIGSQMLSNIHYNIYTKDSQGFFLSIGSDYSKHYYRVPAKLAQFIVSLGFTLGQTKAYGNNMLRLLRKPLFTNY